MSAQLADDLRMLAEVGKIRTAFLPGMRVILDRGLEGGRIPFRRSDDGRRWVFPNDLELHNSIIYRDGVPCLDDAATIGCLMALAREATGDDGSYAAPVEDAGHWEAYAGIYAGLAATEGEAWAEVLHAAAEAVRGGQ